MTVADGRDDNKEQQLGLRIDKLTAEARALESTALAHMQAVLHSIEKDSHHEEQLPLIQEESRSGVCPVVRGFLLSGTCCSCMDGAELPVRCVR